MFPELNSFLNIETSGRSAGIPADGTSISVVESGVGGADASFLVHHFISAYLRAGQNVCLLALAQSFNHYACVAGKLGINLSQHRSAGRFVVIEALKSIGGDIARRSSARGDQRAEKDINCSPSCSQHSEEKCDPKGAENNYMGVDQIPDAKSAESDIPMNTLKDAKQIDEYANDCKSGGHKLTGAECLKQRAPLCPELFCAKPEERDCLKVLYLEIKGALDHQRSILPNTNSTVLLVVDDLSILIALGFAVGDVATFAGYLQGLVCTPTPSGGEGGGALLCLTHCDAGDEDMVRLCTEIGYRSDLVARVSPLRTGYCRDVDGELTVDFRLTRLCAETRSMHFKISDKNIALFPPGTSAAVL